jgi:glutamate-1-semialdehyde 2,1-aminomutase
MPEGPGPEVTVTDVGTRQELTYRRAVEVVPGGVHSSSRLRSPHPLFVARAEGAYVWDLDGERYLDRVMGNGAVMLGHADPHVAAAVRRAVDTGLGAGFESELSVRVAEQFLEQVPGAEQVRFANTGTEVAVHALMIARHATGPDRIAKVEGSYHGWHDFLYVSTRPSPERWGPAEAPQPTLHSALSHRRTEADVDAILASAERAFAGMAGRSG